MLEATFTIQIQVTYQIGEESVSVNVPIFQPANLNEIKLGLANRYVTELVRLRQESGDLKSELTEEERLALRDAYLANELANFTVGMFV